MARDTNITVRLRDRFSQGMSRLTRGLRSLRSSLFNIRTAAAAAVAALGGFAAVRGVSRFFTSALGIARSFEAQMQTVRAVTGATGEEFDKLAEAAREAGASTIFTATEAAQGLEELSRAGLDASESVQSLGSVLNFAQANAINVAEAATQLTTSLNQFGLGADQASRVADVLTKTAASSATNVTQLGNAMSYAAPLARQAGVSIEEAAAIIGSLADQGFRGERAGTALRQAFALLQDPASKASKALEEAGINSRDFTEIIGILGQDAEKAKQVLLSLPLEVRPAIAALVQQGSCQIEELTGTLQDSAGATQDAADTMADSFDGAMKALGSAWEAVKEQLVEPLIGPITEQIKDLTGRIREFSKSEGFKRIQEGLVQGFKDAAAAVREFIGDFDADKIADKVTTATGKMSSFVTSTVDFFGSLERMSTIVSSSWEVARESINFTATAVERFGAKVRIVMLRIQEMTSINPFANFEEEIKKTAERLQELDTESEKHAGNLHRALQTLKAAWSDEGQAADKAAESTKAAGEAAEETATKLEKINLAAYGVEKRLEELPPSIEMAEVSLGELSDAAGEGATAQKRLREELERQNPTLEQTGESYSQAASQLGTWQKVIKAWKGETKEAGNETEKTADKTRDLGTAAQQAGTEVEGTGEAFEKAQQSARGVGQAIADIVGRYRELGGTVGEVGQSVISNAGRMTTTVMSFFRNMGRDLRRVESEYQRNAEAFDRWRAKLEAGEITAARFAQEIRSIGGEAALLDKQRLDFFRQQLEQAQREAAELRREFRQLNQEIERDFLSATGAEAELIRRDFDRREEQLRAAFEALSFQERQAQRDEFQESLRRLKELEKQKLNELRERQQAERKGNEETHRQRESDATEFHEGELDRARKRGQANAGAVVDYNELERQAQAFHRNEMQREAERHKQRQQNLTAEQQQLAGGAGGFLAGGRTAGETSRLEIVHRVLSDALNGQQLSIGEEQVRQITSQVLERLVADRMVGGLYGHG